VFLRKKLIKMAKLLVVIPCRNEVKNIEECITAIYDSELDATIELYVTIVDGKSDDGTLELISKLKCIYSTLNVIENSHQFTPYAFNLGIKSRDTDFYQIVGARQILSKNYLSKSIEILTKNTSIWCVGGNVKNVYLNEIGEIISKAMSTSFGMGLGNFRTLESSGFVDTVGTPMYPSWVFDKIGYFDEELVRNQDDDFNFRVTKAKGKIWLETSIFLKYYVRANFQGLFSQFYQYGYWKVYVNKKHKAITTVRQLAPPMFALLVLCYPLFLLKVNVITVSMSLVLCLYSLLLIVFSTKTATKSKEFFPLLRTFVTLHMSYGLGYLVGIIHFFLLNKKPSNKQKQLSR